MDPNTSLTMLRNLVDSWDRRGRLHPSEWDELAGLVQALDEWIMRGGFLPSDWCETASTLCQASIDGFHCSRPIHRDDWAHVALTSDGHVRRRWTDAEPDHPEPQKLEDLGLVANPWEPEPLGPPDPAGVELPPYGRLSGPLVDEIQLTLSHAGEVARRMREERGR